MPYVLYFTSSLDDKSFNNEIERASRKLFGSVLLYRVNRVHRGEEYLNFGFLCVNSSEFYNALLGNNLDSTPRVRYIEKEGSVEDWADDEYEEEKLEPLVCFEDIRFSEASVPIPDDRYSSNVICCRDFSQGISVKKLIKEISFYSSAKNYPKLHFRETDSGRIVLFLTFYAGTNDAQKAFLMIKQLRIANKTLKFSQSYKNPRKDII